MQILISNYDYVEYKLKIIYWLTWIAFCNIYFYGNYQNDTYQLYFHSHNLNF